MSWAEVVGADAILLKAPTPLAHGGLGEPKALRNRLVVWPVAQPSTILVRMPNAAGAERER